MTTIRPTLPARPGTLDLAELPQSCSLPQALSKIEDRTGNQLTIVSLYGLPGSLKTTTAKSISQVIGEDLVIVSLNGEDKPMMSMDYLLRNARVDRPAGYFDSVSVEDLRRDLHRKGVLESLIKGINNNENTAVDNLYDSADQGQLTGQLTISPPHPDAPILIVDGLTSKVALDLIDPEVMKVTTRINILVNTDPAVSVLDTLKRAAQDPVRKKDPSYAFREFLKCSETLLPGYLEYDLAGTDFIASSSDLDQSLFEQLVEFFRQPAFQELIPALLSFVDERTGSYPQSEIDPERVKTIIDAYREHLSLVLKKIQQLTKARDLS